MKLAETHMLTKTPKPQNPPRTRTLYYSLLEYLLHNHVRIVAPLFNCGSRLLHVHQLSQILCVRISHLVLRSLRSQVR